jgi:hypothetical protein
MKRILALIFVLALFLRFYQLSELPYGFDGDEASLGYYAYSLRTNLSDEYGNKLPLYFPSIGDYKYPGYPYLSVLPVALLGLNVFSTRFLSAMLGSLLCIVVFFLASELFNKKVGIVAGILTAISPYGIMFSRGAYESNVATFLVALTILLLARGLKRENPRIIFYAIIPLVISVFTYPSTRVFLLLLLPAIYVIVRKRFLTKFTLIALAIIILSLLDPLGRIRAADIGILKDPWPNTHLTDSIMEDGWVSGNKFILISRVFHNKPMAYFLDIGKRYAEHFNPVYLFFVSNPNMPKYSIPNVGLFYFFEIATMILGIVVLGKQKKFPSLLVGLWIAASVVPSALSVETPSPIRTLVGLPAWVILSSLGVVFLSDLFSQRKKIIFTVLFGALLIFHLAYFWHQYGVHDSVYRPWYSDEGVAEMISGVNSLQANYKAVVVPKDPYIFFLFFNAIRPQDFLENSEILPEKPGVWERVNKLGRIVFKMPYDCPKIGMRDVLYVCRGQEIPLNANLLKVVRFKDNTPAFLLIEFVPYSLRNKEAELPSGVHRMVETDTRYPEGLLPADSLSYW